MRITIICVYTYMCVYYTYSCSLPRVGESLMLRMANCNRHAYDSYRGLGCPWGTACLAYTTNLPGYWSHMCFITILEIDNQVSTICTLKHGKLTSCVFEKKIILVKFWRKEKRNVLAHQCPLKFSLFQRIIVWRLYIPCIKRGEISSSLTRSLGNWKLGITLR